MSINNFITNLLNLKDPNLIFLEKVERMTKKDITYNLISAKLSDTRTHLRRVITAAQSISNKSLKMVIKQAIKTAIIDKHCLISKQFCKFEAQAKMVGRSV